MRGYIATDFDVLGGSLEPIRRESQGQLYMYMYMYLYHGKPTYSFQKLTQFSKGNNRIDGATSNKDVFLRRGILS
jgi:hypothetical protein